MADESDGNTEAERRRKRIMARSVVVAFAAAGAAFSAVPLPVKDAAMLSPLEVAEINALADVYGIPRDEDAYRLLETTVGLGLASTATGQIVLSLEGRLHSRVSAGRGARSSRRGSSRPSASQPASRSTGSTRAS